MAGTRILAHWDDAILRITRVWFGSDGSYYVAFPVKAGGRATFSILTFNYAKSSQTIAFEDAVDLADALAPDKEIKLTHHPDGFLQFSGAGLVSGRDEKGIKGIGVMTWPLANPTSGPAFGIVVNHPSQILERVQSAEVADLFFGPTDIARLTSGDQLHISGHYFPPLWRRFVRVIDGEPMISVQHPAGAVLNLRVVFPERGCKFPGFVGLEAYAVPSDDERPAIFVSGSTGNLRRNEQGEQLGDGITCMYPDLGPEARRSLDFVRTPSYQIPAIEPTEPPNREGRESA